jgi:PhzF family phenazine biosynthesis protein
MRLPIYQVDAFTDRLFAGNPAAVVPLREWLPDDVLLAIAVENNLSETAYVVPDGDGWELRWFAPNEEVDLCGHATLATAFVLSGVLGVGGDRLRFSTRKAGTLIVTREGDRYTLDLPSRPGEVAPVDPKLLAALDLPEGVEARLARDYMLVVPDAAAVRSIVPDEGRLAETGWYGIIVTAPGDEEGVDFVSRFFSPSMGIPEDPVTGSSHCTLAPYWAQRLGRTELHARQVSPRGGALDCRLAGDRVLVSGRAVLYLEGSIQV